MSVNHIVGIFAVVFFFRSVAIICDAMVLRAATYFTINKKGRRVLVRRVVISGFLIYRYLTVTNIMFTLLRPPISYYCAGDHAAEISSLQK